MNQSGLKEFDVTSQMSFGNPDDEFLPVTKCACGHEHEWWDFVLSIYADLPTECPKCHRKFYFKQTIQIIEVSNEPI